MKANEAPKRIYLSDFTDITEAVFYVKKDNTKENDIEYVRKDAFIEKAYKFMVEVFEIEVSKQEFIEDFKKYMKGE